VFRIPPDRWLAAGAALLGAGATLAVGYWIYTLDGPDREFWRWPGLLGVGLALVGAVMLVRGLLGRAPTPSPSQVQRGGDRSTNVQAGRDVHVDVGGRNRP